MVGVRFPQIAIGGVRTIRRRTHIAQNRIGLRFAEGRVQSVEERYMEGRLSKTAPVMGQMRYQIRHSNLW